jgi:murein DD-endopeptidase MepM/ murein hydrolase activator NlpD
MKRQIRRVIRGITGFFTQHITVKVVPESAAEGFSFRVNTGVVLFFVVFSLSLVGGVTYLLQVTAHTPDQIARQSNDLRNLQANVDKVISELHSVISVARPLNEELDHTFAGFAPLSSQRGTLASLNRLQMEDFFQDLPRQRSDDARDAVEELMELRRLLVAIEGSVDTLSDVRDLFASKEQYLQDVPHFWPVENGLGVVTMEYGPNVHPFTGQWYMHKGFDIAGPIGLPLVASANGTVTDIGFDPGYGNYIEIRHRWGFYTKYAHMSQIYVRTGQQVRQGERIGTLGSSGFATGSHIHFEVIIGGEVLDPAPFLQISNTFQRGGHASTRRR